jgi:hypothetical protein
MDKMDMHILTAMIMEWPGEFYWLITEWRGEFYRVSAN